ncbi:MAG: sulfite exporter TauE/SafE family protein [Thermofilaceae archaeon]
MLFAPLIGLLAGIIGSMFGLGGGFLVVPLLNIAGVDMKIAIGTSVTAIFFNAVSATVAYARYGYVIYKVGALVSATAIPSAYLGAILTKYLDTNVLRCVFGMLLISVAFNVVIVKESENGAQFSRMRWTLKTYFTLLCGGILAGIASGLFGIGGGVINVPLLTHIGFTMQYAAAISSMAVALTSITSAFMHYTLGNVDLSLLTLLVPTLVVGARIGAAVAIKTSSSALRKGFFIVLTVIALRMVLKGLGYQIP